MGFWVIVVLRVTTLTREKALLVTFGSGGRFIEEMGRTIRTGLKTTFSCEIERSASFIRESDRSVLCFF